MPQNPILFIKAPIKGFEGLARQYRDLWLHAFQPDVSKLSSRNLTRVLKHPGA